MKEEELQVRLLKEKEILKETQKEVRDYKKRIQSLQKMMEVAELEAKLEKDIIKKMEKDLETLEREGK